MKFYKYHGAGNDFILFDNREENRRFNSHDIKLLCDRHYGIGADGLILLNKPLRPESAFSMEFYNSDGSGGMMCGNGARCLVAFAADLGFTDFTFDGPDAPHTASILSHGEEKIVKLHMIDVDDIKEYDKNNFFLNTGTRHHVKFVDEFSKLVITPEDIALRHSELYAPEGSNVNIAYKDEEGRIHVRTFEKGVEAETQACGTGIVAVALADAFRHHALTGQRNLKALGGDFRVDFSCGSREGNFTDVYLTGPARFVATFETSLV